MLLSAQGQPFILNRRIEVGHCGMLDLIRVASFSYNNQPQSFPQISKFLIL